MTENFPIGITTIVFTAENQSTNLSTSCFVNVSVEDLSPPDAANCPVDIEVEIRTLNSAIVTIGSNGVLNSTVVGCGLYLNLNLPDFSDNCTNQPTVEYSLEKTNGVVLYGNKG